MSFRKQESLIQGKRSILFLYKNIILPPKYYADFVIDDKIILEAKAIECLTKAHVKVTLNYLAIPKLRIGLLVNFGEDSLVHQRVI